MSPVLSTAIHQGLLNLPGSPQSKDLVERLLQHDRQQYHCVYGRFGYHNHLSHHLLAAYDLGAPPKLLQAIYDAELQILDPIHPVDQQTKEVKKLIGIDATNWQQFLGQKEYYPSYVEFFSKEIEKLGASPFLEEYVFAPAANENGADMSLRFVSGAVHPTIQTGYGAEFGSDAMVSQGIAQAAIHSLEFVPELFRLSEQYSQGATSSQTSNDHRQPARGKSLLAILREVYDSPILKPVMPYKTKVSMRSRIAEASKNGRPEEISRLAETWEIDTSRGQGVFDEKVEELLWLTTLLLFATGKKGRKPRLDFFLVHLLDASLFVPSLVKVIPGTASKVKLLRSLLPVILMYLIVRGRPRIDPELVMTYSSTPRPPHGPDHTPRGRDSGQAALGDPNDEGFVDPWPAIISSVNFAPDAHTVKAVRTLYFAAKQYGTTPAGGLIGAFREDGSETHTGIGKVDGTLFVRAAGVVMDTLGWIDYGQKLGTFDQSALGWDDAWKNEDN